MLRNQVEKLHALLLHQEGGIALILMHSIDPVGVRTWYRVSSNKGVEDRYILEEAIEIFNEYRN